MRTRTVRSLIAGTAIAAAVVGAVYGAGAVGTNTSSHNTVVSTIVHEAGGGSGSQPDEPEHD